MGSERVSNNFVGGKVEDPLFYDIACTFPECSCRARSCGDQKGRVMIPVLSSLFLTAPVYFKVVCVSGVSHMLYSTLQQSFISRLRYCRLVSYLDLSKSLRLSSPTWLVRYPRQRMCLPFTCQFLFSFVHFLLEDFSFKSSR